MSFFPTADPEKPPATMAHDPVFYPIVATPPSQQQQDPHDEYDPKSTWSSIATTSHDTYPVSHAPTWSSQPHGLGLESLPTPTQSMFDQAYSTATPYDAATSWAHNATTMSTSTTYPAYTTQDSVLSYYSFTTPLATPPTWDSTHNQPSSVESVYDSPPTRSDYSTSSAQSLTVSSPYAHSDGCFQLGSAPLIKVEESIEYQRPRLYSVPGLMSCPQPSHVNPGDLYSSPPLTASDQHTMDALQAASRDEIQESKPALLRPQRTQTRRAVSEDSLNRFEGRTKRGYTTQANSTCKCPECGKLFQRSYNLKAHMETHDPHREQPHLCTYLACRRRFVRKTDLLRHEQSVSLIDSLYYKWMLTGNRCTLESANTLVPSATAISLEKTRFEGEDTHSIQPTRQNTHNSSQTHRRRLSPPTGGQKTTTMHQGLHDSATATVATLRAVLRSQTGRVPLLRRNNADGGR